MGEDGSSLTRLQIYCSALYNIFDEDSEVVNLDGHPVKLWRGFVTQASAKLEIPEGVRNRVINRLEDVGSIQVVERGRRNVMTSVVLLTPPTAEVWDAYERDFTIGGLTSRPDPAILSAQVKEITQQIGGLPISEMFANLETRLKSVETKLRELEEIIGEGSPKTASK